MEKLFPAFNAEEAFVASPLSSEECLRLADGLRAIVAQLEEHGEERRLELLAGAEPSRAALGPAPRA